MLSQTRLAQDTSTDLLPPARTKVTLPGMISQTHLAQDTSADLLLLVQIGVTLPGFPRSKRQLPLRIEAWPPGVFQRLFGGLLQGTEHAFKNTHGTRY